MKDNFLTVLHNTTGLYKEKGSKFTAYLYRISSEEEALKLVSELKKHFYDARHHCYAYQLGVEGERYRENDDGEPSGTAGKPIRGQIRSNNLTNILIVVVRYFGGTKLGVPGLINAYKSAAADAIANAQVVEELVEETFQIQCGFQQINDVMRLAKDSACRVLGHDYSEFITITVALRMSKVDVFVAQLSKVCRDAKIIR